MNRQSFYFLVGAHRGPDLIIHTLPGFISECSEQLEIGIEEVVRRRENESSVRASVLKCLPHGSARLLRGAPLQEMELVEAADHAHPVTDPLLCFGKNGIAPHFTRRKRFHRVRVHVRNLLKDRHHATTGMIDNPLAGRMCELDQLRIIGCYKLLKKVW